jgi:uncharacterized coiled-coil protein SlyX
MADSPTARINKLEQSVAVQAERLDALTQEVRRINIPALLQRLAVLESQVKDLREGNQEWARRAWAIVGPIVGAIAGALLAYVFRR